MKKILLFVAVLSLSGCSTHMYQTSNYNVSETQVVLDQANFEVCGKAEGNASNTYVFGIGGLSRKALRGNAVAAMYEDANLKGSQTIINVYFKKRQMGFAPFYWNTTYTATGTIVEFRDNNAEPTVAPSSYTTSRSATVVNEANTRAVRSYNVGDMVEYDGVTAMVVKVDGKKLVLAALVKGTYSWNEVKQLCIAMGNGWTMPSAKILKEMDKVDLISYHGCWTDVELGDTKAKAYYQGVSLAMETERKDKKLKAIPIATVRATDVR